METMEDIRLPWPEWKIVRYIGGGGYGKVYEIERNMEGILEKAAVKIIARPRDESEIEEYYDNGYSQDTAGISFDNELRNYVKEYQFMKELQGQTHIVSCDDYAIVRNENGIGGKIFLRMELLTSLQQILRERSLSEKEIIKLGKDISHALMLCESKKIIHRDIKPCNILLSPFGDYKLGDFGVSKVMNHTTFATAMGTQEYQAPEVVHMEKYGQTADIYSLGITLYWLLNNRKMPFVSADEMLTPMVKEQAAERRYRGEKLPEPRDGSTVLKQIVLKACAYRPEDRYASARELYEALDALKNEKNISDKATESYTKTVPPEWEERDSWGNSVGTIGVAGKKKETKEFHKQEPEEEKTVGAKQVYQKQVNQQKPEPQKILTEEKKIESDVEGYMCFWPGVAALISTFGAEDVISKFIRIVRDMPIPRMIFIMMDTWEIAWFVGMAAAWIALSSGILYYRRARKGTVKRKLVGNIYICSMIVFAIFWPYGFVNYNYNVDVKYHITRDFMDVFFDIGSYVTMIGVVVWLINMVRKDMKKLR